MPQCEMDIMDELVQLEPFAHQVGGHSAVLRYNDSTVCKGLVLRELQFYKSMPPEMKQFTPQFRGVIEVATHTDSNGYITLVARPPARLRRNSLTSSLPNLTNERVIPRTNLRASSLCPNHDQNQESEQEDQENKVNIGVKEEVMEENCEEEETQVDCVNFEKEYITPELPDRHRFRIQRTDSVEIEELSRDVEALGLEEGGGCEVDDSGRVFSTKHNMWSMRCHREHLAKISNDQPDQFFNKFILLENLTCNYELPCVLDLKMGTRQHGDDASEEKKQSQMNKCHMTTSSCLGVRICGMQVYQANSRSYVCQDKYFGRQLDEKGVHDTLYQFLHNGSKFLVELIEPILERLRELLTVLTNKVTFRFYSSSLLIMYDAADFLYDPVVDHSKGLDTIDLSHRNVHTSPDWIILDSPLSHHRNLRRTSTSYEARTLNFNSTNDKCRISEETKNESELLAESRMLQNNRENSRNSCRMSRAVKMNVRMIDFAHSTHHGFLDDKTPHVGPDHGYLFGLKNLIRLFEELQAAHT